MIKNLIKVLPILFVLGLSACNKGSNTSSSTGSSELPTTKEATIYFFLDYNHAVDEENPYYIAEWYLGVPFTKEDIGLVDPTSEDASYSEFKVFKGWSVHPVIDSDDQLWNFGEDFKEKDERGVNLQLFGIWVDA
ncbi:MAG: hypothetical protein K5906_04365 [Bacilli bacterium]|nr:hypothetical protein [Bacilli bacterium]